MCSKEIDIMKASRLCEELGYDSALSYEQGISIFSESKVLMFFVNTGPIDLCSSEHVVSLRCLTGRTMILISI